MAGRFDERAVPRGKEWRREYRTEWWQEETVPSIAGDSPVRLV
jgi:hypothetical protein